MNSNQMTNGSSSGKRIDGRLQSLFFASQNQVELMRFYPDLVLIDATYKSNRYKMPLVHFGGVTPINSFFSAAFCFMPGEDEEEYMWCVEQFKNLVCYDLKPPEAFITDNDKALRNALSRVFEGIPRLLCIWHIQQKRPQSRQEDLASSRLCRRY
jgi:MULE transposase domain